MRETYQYLPEEWYKPNLAELGRICTGTTPPTSDQSNYGGDLPFIGPSDLGRRRWIDSYSEKLTRKGELLSRTADKDAVLVSCIGILGKVGQAKEKLSFNQQINSIQPNKDKVDAGFLYYASNRLQGRLNKLAGLQVVPIVNKNLFSKLEILAPKRLEEQRWIANVLDTLDTQIQQTEALISKLEKVKEGLLHDLLTRGIDENGQLRPSPEQAPELYKASPLGLIPREWSVGSLGNLSEIVSGVTLGGKSGSSAWPLVPYLRVANVQDGYLDLTDIKRIRVSPADIEKYRLLPGDVLMNEGGDFDKLGRGALWQGQIEFCLHQNHVFRVRTNPGVLSPYFLAAYSSSVAGKRYFIRSSKQSTNLASINSTQLKAFQVPLPSSAEQILIIKELQAMASKIESEKAFLDKMIIQKSGLMDDILTGRVRVTQLLDKTQQTTLA
ncbi:restriction endonuclease subunit S [Vreelandella neptunia]|uniref:Restriction endonuclease subunit S n=1 Tax=Vreelandella neptunia TaxID=115551 RepID=A0ABZ0YH40_9GAMM|nr:restriction endonuclease subunit S [Halomonas neptunia]MDN3559797.1 restriction endonuclease subunit S [Halomonas neptunia]WQH11430.1 restriction endonuclease subunit S [Halomonas neptunia]